MQLGRITLLIALLATFTWLLSESLELVFRRIETNKPKAIATGLFATFLACVEIWVHHHGAIWLFGDETSLLWKYRVATGFVFATITSKWLYMTDDAEFSGDNSLGSNISHINAQLAASA